MIETVTAHRTATTLTHTTMTTLKEEDLA